MATTSEATKPAANLWDHLTTEEIERLRGQARAEEEAIAEVSRIATKAEEVEQTLTALSARRYPDMLGAAARALGEAAPLPERKAVPVDRSELEEQLAGLRVRLTGAEDLARRQRGVLRATIVDLVRTVAVDRLAPEYVRLTDLLVDLFATLSGAEDFMLSLAVGGDYGKVRHIADRMTWGRIYLPGSTDLPAIAKRSHEEWSLPVVLSGESALERGIGAAAYGRFKDSVTATLGRWPFN